MRFLSCLVFIALTFSGCLFVPVIDAMKQAGLTESDRMQLLPPTVSKFTSSLSWPDKSEAMRYVAQESRQEVAEGLELLGEDVKIVDSRVSNVNYEDNARKAVVNINVRFYQVPYYVVKTRKDKQTWEFGSSSGWQLIDIETQIDQPKKHA